MESVLGNKIFEENGKKRRVNFFLPSIIHFKIKRLAERTRQTESDILRRAIIAYIEQAEQTQLENEVKEACENYRVFNKSFSPKWAQFETRIK